MKLGISFLALALPLSAALDFNSGSYGTIGLTQAVFAITPTGGTGPYVFSYAPSATPIPGFRVLSAPELPSSFTSAQKGALAGLATTTGLKSTTIRLTDTFDGSFVDKAVSFTVSPIDFAGTGPNYYSIGDIVNQKWWPVGGTPPYTYTISSGTLPPGLSLSTTVINGVAVAVIGGVIDAAANTATTSGSNSYSFTITAKDAPQNSLAHSQTMIISAMQLKINGSPLNNSGNRNLSNGTVGSAYNQQITVTGGTAPYTFSTNSGLPAGLTLSSTGLISGTPTSSTFTTRATVTVTDSASPAHTMNVRLGFKVLPTPTVPLGFSTNTIADTAVGFNISRSIYATGGKPPYTFDVDPMTPLPAGAFLIQGYEYSPDQDPDGCWLRVRIQTAGDYTFNLKVLDAGGNSATRAYTLHVPPLGTNNPNPNNATLGAPFSQYLVPLGGTPPYTITPTNIPAGLTLDNNDLLSGTPTEAGDGLSTTYTVTDSANIHFAATGSMNIIGDTVPYLNLTGGDLGTIQLGVQNATNLSATGSAQSPPVFTVTLVSGTLPPGLKLVTGGDFSNGGNVTIAAQLAGIATSPGVYAFTYRVVDGLGRAGQRQAKIRVSSMAIVNSGIAPGAVGVAYSQTFDVRGGTTPYTFSLTTGNLPPGLSLDTSTGAITGTPTSTASSNITLQVNDNAGGILARTFTLNIYSLSMTESDILPDGVFGSPYSHAIVMNPAGTYTYTATGLPSGLSIGSSSGIISGTVNATGTFNITLTAINSVSAVISRNFTMFVPPISTLINGLPTAEILVNGVSTPYLGSATVGNNTIFTLGFNGGVPPYTVSLVPPSVLPPGLGLSIGSPYQGTSNFGRWTLLGVPTTAGVYSFKLRYTDSTGVSSDRTVCLQITNLGLATATPHVGIVNQPYAAQLMGVGGNGTYSYALSPIFGNVMPPGLSLSATGAISGTPTSTAAFTPSVDITSGTETRRLTVNITINPASGGRIDFTLGPILTDAGVGRAVVFAMTPTGGTGTHTWTVDSGSLPPGVVLLASPSLPTNFSAPTALLAGAPTTEGTYNFRIRVVDSVGNSGQHDATLQVSSLVFSPQNQPWTLSTFAPPLHVGTPYTFVESALNGHAPLTFSVDRGTLLPEGMSYTAQGQLTGTPSQAGNFTLNGRLTDLDGKTRAFSATLNSFQQNKPIIPQVTNSGGSLPPSATIGANYSLTLNDFILPGYGTPPFVWTLNEGTLPPGLSIVTGTGGASDTLSGMATTPGLTIFGLRVTDANGFAVMRNMQLLETPLAISPGPGALPGAVAGTPYTTNITATGGTGPYTFTKAYDSDMPSGLAIASDGTLSGSPAGAGVFVLIVNAADSAGNNFRQRYLLTISQVSSLSIAKTHVGSLLRGQNGALYTLRVTNSASASDTTGTVTVTENVPVGLTLVSMAGSGWNCTTNTCTRSDVLSPGASYPPITVTVNVASNAAALVTNQATVSGGGSPSNTANDATTVLAPFNDVATTDFFFNAVNLMREYAITGGCSASPPLYCPNDNVTRAQMAIFMVRAVFGGDNFTFSATPYFNDVPADAFGFKWIQKMKELNITAGCGNNNYCPNDQVTRGQMGIFVIRARLGAAADPTFTYPANPYFTDVPVSHPYFKWIQRMRLDLITGGCGNGSTYCPDDPVTRGQMAIFIMRGAFNQLLVAGTPVLTGVSPSVAAIGSSGTVTIVGANTNFVQGTTQLAPVPGVTVGTITVTSATSMTVQITVAANATAGPRSLVATTGSEQAVLPNGLIVQ